jgi:hypothetical protein
MKKILYLIIIALAAGYFSSCKNMDEPYKEFVVPSGLTYPQKPDSLKVQAGYNTLRITWLKAKDPSVVRAEIYWNNYLDTLAINNISTGGDTIIVDISDLEEIAYTFHVRTFDADGNASISVEASGTPYGEGYIMRTTDRAVASAVFDNDNNGLITWGAKTADLVYSEVHYTISSGDTRIVRILPDEATLTCPDAKPGALFEYRSVFLPPKGRQVIEKEWITDNSFDDRQFLRAGWTAESRGGNHPWGDGGGGQPALIFDGNIATGWHSNVNSSLPQCMVVDMKKSLAVHHIVLYPPTNTAWRYMRNIEVYISNAPITPDVPQPSWGAPIAEVVYTGGDSFTIDFPSVPSCQYIAMVFLNSTSGGPHINLMEFEVYRY